MDATAFLLILATILGSMLAVVVPAWVLRIYDTRKLKDAISAYNAARQQHLDARDEMQRNNQELVSLVTKYEQGLRNEINERAGSLQAAFSGQIAAERMRVDTEIEALGALLRADDQPVP